MDGFNGTASFSKEDDAQMIFDKSRGGATSRYDLESKLKRLQKLNRL